MASVNFGADVYVDGELETEDDLTVGGQVVSLVDLIAPFVVTSTVLNENLNADLLDGEHGSYYLDLANATGVLGVAYGGTGLSTVGSAGQLLRSTGTGLEYFTHDFISSTLLGAVNGVATLDATGKVPLVQLPTMGMQYKGTWDASTNTPTLSDGTGNEGEFYRVVVGGIVNLGSGSIEFKVGDDVIHNGIRWELAPAGSVTPDLQAVTDQGATTTNNITVSNSGGGVIQVMNADDGSYVGHAVAPTMSAIVGYHASHSFGIGSDSSLGAALLSFVNNTTSDVWSLEYSSGLSATLGAGNQLRVQQDPVHDNDLARKLYVDTGLSAKFDIPTGTTSQYIRGDGSLATFPSIPTVGDGVLTLAVGTGLTGSAMFTANQSGNSTFTVGLGTNLANLNAVTNTGFLKRTGTNTWSVDTTTYMAASNAYTKTESDARYLSSTNKYVSVFNNPATTNSVASLDFDVAPMSTILRAEPAVNSPEGSGLIYTFGDAGSRAYQLFQGHGYNDSFWYRTRLTTEAGWREWLQVSSRSWVDTNYYTKTASDAKYALLSNSVSAGNGLTGGGAISSNPSITLGTPGNITLASTNSVSSDSHTHAFVPGGSTSQYIRGDGSLATFPTIGDGTLTLTVGTGLTGSASFTANQSGNSTFTVGLGTNLSNLNALSTNGFVKKTGANTWTIDTSTYLTSVALGDLTNVTLSSPTNGQVLTYNGSAWVNSTPSFLPSSNKYVSVFNNGATTDVVGNLDFDSAPMSTILRAEPAVNSPEGAGLLYTFGDSGSRAFQLFQGHGFNDSFWYRTRLTVANGWRGWLQVASRDWVTSQNYALASAIPTNYVTTNTNQSSLGGNKAWTGSHSWALSSNVTPSVLASSIAVGKATSGLYLIAYDNDANQAFALRTYAASNYQLTLDKGGVETSNHGNSSQWNSAYTWVNTYGSGLQGGPYVPTSRVVSAGNGLTGGGALSGNVTVTLGTPGNITLSSSNSVSTNSHTHAFVPGGSTSQYIRGDGSLATFPTIPTVNNGTLTLSTSGSGLSGSASFTANQSGNSTFTVSVASGYTIPNNDQVSHWEQAYGWGNHASAGYVQTSRQVNTSGSLQGGGNLGSNRTLSLVNDSGSPGGNKYYGTNGAGVKGFYDLPSGGGGTLTGGGSSGYISKWSGGTSLDSSVIYQNGSNIGIGTTSPDQKLTISGGLSTYGNVAFRPDGGGNGNVHVWRNLVIGDDDNNIQGTILIHDGISTGNIHASTAFEVRSTSKGIGLPVLEQFGTSSPAKNGVIFYYVNPFGADRILVHTESGWRGLAYADEL